MATKSSKRGTRSGKAKRRGKRGQARATAKRTAARRTAAKSNPSAPTSPSSSKAPRRSPRKRLPAWNEIEIDEQRESAGRPEPAFLSDGAYADDDLAEEMGEEFVMTATSGEQAAEDFRNQDVPEELGGPFVETSARTEFAYGSDPSNPKDAEPSAFPMAINSPEEEAAQSEDEQEERTS
jgi:hypothetical protein